MRRKKGLLLSLFVFLALVITVVASADPTAMPTAPADGVAPLAVPTEAPLVTVDPNAPEIELAELLDLLGKVVSDWRTMGLLAGLVALVGLLIAALRFKPLNNLLEDKGFKWIKPYVAAGLGALLTFFSSMQTGAGWLQSLLLGLGVGLMAVGGHQVLTKGNKE